jgi:calcium-dependent protein kinase
MSKTAHRNKKGKTDLQADVGLLEAFREFDKDNSGYITVDEFRNVLSESGEATMSEQEINEMIAKVDKNSDKKIKYPEFIELMKEFMP